MSALFLKASNFKNNAVIFNLVEEFSNVLPGFDKHSLSFADAVTTNA